MINENDIIYDRKCIRSDNNVATYGWEGNGSAGFKNYYIGYKTAVEAVNNKFLQASRRHEIEITDTIVYPLCFLIRHCAELFLKYIFVSYSNAEEQKKIEFFNRANHNIFNTWSKDIRPIVKKLSDTQPNSIKIEILDSYFKQIQEFDDSSFKMRYPCKKNNIATNDKNEALDVGNLIEKMLAFFDYLERIDQVIYNTTFLYYTDFDTEEVVKINDALKACEGKLIELKKLVVQNLPLEEIPNDNVDISLRSIPFGKIPYKWMPFWEEPIGKFLMQLEENILKVIVLFIYSSMDLLYARCAIVDKDTRKDFVKIMISNISECDIRENTEYKVMAEEHVDKISGYRLEFLNKILEKGFEVAKIVQEENNDGE